MNSHSRAWRRLTGAGLAAGLMMVAGLAVPGLSTTAHAAEAPPTLDLAAYRGKVVYLDFWASWCAPCKLSFGFMNALHATYGDKDLVILAVNVDHDRAAAAGFLNAVGGHPQVIYDPKGTIAGHYDVATMPTTVLFDRTGKQRFVHRGYFPNKTREYDGHVAALIAEHP